MGDYKLYLEKNKVAWEKSIKMNYCNLEKCEVRTIPNGVILPLKKKHVANNSAINQLFEGGVQNREGRFEAGHIRKKGIKGAFNYECLDTYEVSEPIDFQDYDVVFGGILINMFGHILTEGLSRLWYLKKEKEKIVFLNTDNSQVPEYFYSLLSFLNISKEQIIFLDKATRYRNVIVPDQALILHSGFHADLNKVYDRIAKYIEKKETIIETKIYFSRAKLEKKDCINERYFEEYYRNQGYTIVYPEQESLERQIALVRGASHIVCTAGTLSHLIVFAKRGIRLTILLRENEVGAIIPQILLNQMKEVRCEIIDVSLNFLPTTHAGGVFMLGPTVWWKQYVQSTFNEEIPLNLEEEMKKHSYEYVKLWINRYNSNNYVYKRINKMDIFDVVNRMNYVFNHKELSRTAMATPKINESQIKNELNRILIPRDLRVVCPSNHKFIMTWCEEDSGKKKVYLQKRSLTKRIKSNLSTIEAMNYMQHIYKKSSVIITRVKGFTIEDSLIEKFKNSNIDIVLLNHCKLGETIEKQYIKSHGKESWDMMMNVLKEKNKVYYDAAMSIFQGNELFTQNSYIMKKETFNIYISWIKPLIEEIEKRLENKDLLDKLIERLFTLYFLHNKEKYVEAFWVSE